MVGGLENEVEGTAEATLDGMPGNYKGQGHVRQKVDSGIDGKDREDGKPEQGSLVNGNVTKDKQADDHHAPPDIHLDASAKKGDNPPAESDKQDKSNQNEATLEERDEKPSVLQEIDLPDEETDELQGDSRSATKKAKGESGSARPGQPYDTEDASRRSKNDDPTNDDSEGDSDKENRPASSPAPDGDRGVDNDNKNTGSDIDQSLVVVNGNPKADSPAEQKDGSKHASEGGQKAKGSNAEDGGH